MAEAEATAGNRELVAVTSGTRTPPGGKSSDKPNDERSVSHLAKPTRLAVGQTEAVEYEHQTRIEQPNGEVLGSSTEHGGNPVEIVNATPATEADKKVDISHKEPSQRGGENAVSSSNQIVVEKNVSSGLKQQETRAQARPSKFSLQATPFVPAEQRQASIHRAGVEDYAAKLANQAGLHPGTGIITQVSAVCSNGQFGSFTPSMVTCDGNTMNYYPMAANNLYCGAQTYGPIHLQSAVLCPTLPLLMQTNSGVYYDPANVAALYSTAAVPANYPVAGSSFDAPAAGSVLNLSCTDKAADTGYYGNMGVNAPNSDDASKVRADIGDRSGKNVNAGLATSASIAGDTLPQTVTGAKHPRDEQGTSANANPNLSCDSKTPTNRHVNVNRNVPADSNGQDQPKMPRGVDFSPPFAQRTMQPPGLAATTQTGHQLQCNWQSYPAPAAVNGPELYVQNQMAGHRWQPNGQFGIINNQQSTPIPLANLNVANADWQSQSVPIAMHGPEALYTPLSGVTPADPSWYWYSGQATGQWPAPPRLPPPGMQPAGPVQPSLPVQQPSSRSRNRPVTKSAPRYAKEASHNRRSQATAEGEPHQPLSSTGSQSAKRDVQSASGPNSNRAGTGEVVRGVLRIDQMGQAVKLSGVDVRSNPTQFTWSSETDFPALSNPGPNASTTKSATASTSTAVPSATVAATPTTTTAALTSAPKPAPTSTSTVIPATTSTAASNSSVKEAVKQNMPQKHTEVEIKPAVRWSSVAKSPAVSSDSLPTAAQNANKPQSALRQPVPNQPSSTAPKSSGLAVQKSNDRERESARVKQLPAKSGPTPNSESELAAGSDRGALQKRDIVLSEEQGSAKQRADNTLNRSEANRDGRKSPEPSNSNDTPAVDTQSSSQSYAAALKRRAPSPTKPPQLIGETGENREVPDRSHRVLDTDSKHELSVLRTNNNRQRSPERTPQDRATPLARSERAPLDGKERDRQPTKVRNSKRSDKPAPDSDRAVRKTTKQAHEQLRQQETFQLDQDDFPQMTAPSPAMPILPIVPQPTVAVDADFPTLKIANSNIGASSDELVRKRPSAENTSVSVWKKPSENTTDSVWKKPGAEEPARKTQVNPPGLANKSPEVGSVVKVSNSGESIRKTPSTNFPAGKTRNADDAVKKTPSAQVKTGKTLKVESSAKKTPTQDAAAAQSAASAVKVTGESPESQDASKKKKKKLKACGLQLDLASVLEQAAARREQLDAAEHVAQHGVAASVSAKGKESKAHAKPVLAYRLQKTVMNSVDKPVVKAAMSAVKLSATTGEFSHPNVLDCSAPARLRGKEREKPKNKRLSLLKRRIILERISRRKQRAERQADLANAGEPSPKENADTKPVVQLQPVLPTEPSNDPVRSEALSRIHTHSFREYCDHLITRKINRRCYGVLSTLAYYQRRHMQKDPVKARMRKRVVCGLHECAKYARAGSRVCRALIVAPNLEDTPSLNSVVRALIATCARNEIRVLFALSRRTLGDAIHRNAPVACIAILSLAGAEQISTALFELVDQARVTYQDRLAAEMSKIASGSASTSACTVAAKGPQAATSKRSGSVLHERDRFVDALPSARGDDEYEPI